jgi:hypothetical protein
LNRVFDQYATVLRATSQRALATDAEKSLTAEIISAAIEVHRALGPGLLEAAYQACLCRELVLRSLPFRQQVDIPVTYKGVKLDCGYRIDLVVRDKGCCRIEICSGDLASARGPNPHLSAIKPSTDRLAAEFQYSSPEEWNSQAGSLTLKLRASVSLW